MEQYLNQSASTGTLKPSDLIKNLMPVLRDLAPNQWEYMVSEHTLVWKQVNSTTPESAPGSQSEQDTQDTLDELLNRLDNLAPEGYYFGALEGDGADLGFWKEGSDDD